MVLAPDRVPLVTDADQATRAPELAVLSAMAHGSHPDRLDARGIDVPDDARTRITECSDLDQLDTWIRRAATAESIDDLFD